VQLVVLVVAVLVMVVYQRAVLELLDKVLLVALVVVVYITEAAGAVAHLLLVLLEQPLAGVMVALELQAVSQAHLSPVVVEVEVVLLIWVELLGLEALVVVAMERLATPQELQELLTQAEAEAVLVKQAVLLLLLVVLAVLA